MKERREEEETEEGGGKMEWEIEGARAKDEKR